MKKIALLSVLTLFSVLAIAQSKFPSRYKYESIGLTINAMNYVGDLDPASNPFSPALRFTRWSIGGEMTQRFSPRMHARVAFSWGRIEGSDQKSSTTEGDDLFRYQRNLSFRNDIYELKTDLIWDLFVNRRGLQRRLHYTPFLVLGVAAFYHDPKANFNGSWVSLRELGTEGQFIDGVGAAKTFSKIQMAIPFGVGFRYKLTQSLDVSFEIGWRMTFTDYLDDVSGDYIDKQNFEYGSDAYWLSDRSVTPEMVESFSGLSSSELEAQGFYSSLGADGNVHYYKPGYGRGENSIDEWRGDHKSKSIFGKSNDKDWYIITGFHINYIFHPKVVCPKFRG